VRSLLHFAKGFQVMKNITPVEICGTLSNKDAAYIVPIQSSIGKSLHDDEILSRAELYSGTRLHLDFMRPMHGTLFKGQGTQGNINTKSLG